MSDDTILKGKRVLIVDDEPDVLETLEELLNQCLIDKAPSFETGVTYDLAIFDIMGVKGYDLLRLATEKGIPAIMLTAHALSPDNLIKSIKEGAHSYVPKDKLPEIATFAKDILEARQKGAEKPIGSSLSSTSTSGQVGEIKTERSGTISIPKISSPRKTWKKSCEEHRA